MEIFIEMYGSHYSAITAHSDRAEQCDMMWRNSARTRSADDKPHPGLSGLEPFARKSVPNACTPTECIWIQALLRCFNRSAAELASAASINFIFFPFHIVSFRFKLKEKKRICFAKRTSFEIKFRIFFCSLCCSFITILFDRRGFRSPSSPPPCIGRVYVGGEAREMRWTGEREREAEEHNKQSSRWLNLRLCDFAAGTCSSHRNARNLLSFSLIIARWRRNGDKISLSCSAERHRTDEPQ